MDTVVTVVGLVSGVLGIISYFLPIGNRRARWVHTGYVFVVACAVSLATYESGRLKRLDEISRSADRLVAEQEMNYTSRGYVFAVLSFLEKNKDEFPDTYARAVAACKTFKCDDRNASLNLVELSFTFKGIARGLGTLSSAPRGG
jgi:hypothetical protein